VSQERRSPKRALADRLWVQEEEKQLRPGSVKHAVFSVLKARRGCPEGMTAEQILEAAQAEGIKTDWNDKGLKNIKSVSVARGVRVGPARVVPWRVQGVRARANSASHIVAPTRGVVCHALACVPCTVTAWFGHACGRVRVAAQGGGGATPGGGTPQKTAAVGALSGHKRMVCVSEGAARVARSVRAALAPVHFGEGSSLKCGLQEMCTLKNAG